MPFLVPNSHHSYHDTSLPCVNVSALLGTWTPGLQGPCHPSLPLCHLQSPKYQLYVVGGRASYKWSELEGLKFGEWFSNDADTSRKSLS